jgi:putative SOS response-associated peptidase YedK
VCVFLVRSKTPAETSRHSFVSISYSFTMLTINADAHEVMRNFHKPEDEKRMVVILPEERYAHWLAATPEQSVEFVQEFPAQELNAVASPRGTLKGTDSLF